MRGYAHDTYKSNDISRKAHARQVAPAKTLWWINFTVRCSLMSALLLTTVVTLFMPRNRRGTGTCGGWRP